ncbi:hypothetical protein NMY22_g17516 [Coprinellus aureogranulatus]|nr:hypothetical protein NMY22_g17516 [Coprinellus aureogranulatus]
MSQGQARSPFNRAGDPPEYSGDAPNIPAASHVNARQLRLLLPVIRSQADAALLEALANRFGGLPTRLPSKKSVRSIRLFVYKQTGTWWSTNDTADGILFWMDALGANHTRSPSSQRCPHTTRPETGNTRRHRSAWSWEDRGINQLFSDANRIGVDTMYITVNNHSIPSRSSYLP